MLRRSRLLFLMIVLAALPGYKFRCYIFCTDQTGMQNDYVEQRDRCREYAQLKLDTITPAASENDDKARQTQLVTLFSECMAQNGWTVPDGKDKSDTKSPPAATANAPPSATVAEGDDAWRRRASECAFARQSADVSSVAAARADACDRECEQMLDAAPDAPRPAACGDIIDDEQEKGYDK